MRGKGQVCDNHDWFSRVVMIATTEFSRSGGSPGRGEKPAYTVPANLSVALPEPP